MRPRSLLLHFVFVVVGGGCLFAAWWQIERAAAGNVLSYLYSVEWPAFVVVGGIGWWQLVHDTDEDIIRRREHHARVRRASVEVVARTLPRSALALTVESEDVGARSLAGAASRVLPRPHSSSTGTSLEPVAEREAVLLGDEPEPGTSDEMDAYNRYLAYLAVKGKPKSWRNPRGDA